MKFTEIKKIEEILLVDKPLLKHNVASLVTPENGGSLLLNIDLRLKNEKNFEEKLEVVAKLASASTSNSKNRAQSFQNEIIFYRSIVPLLQEFLKLREIPAIDLFPKYYGGRLTMNPRNKGPDQDAIFFLENLKNSGFESLEPHVGFDLNTTKLVLEQISRFHASFLGIKIKKPEIFKHKVKPHINKSENPVDTDEVKRVISLMWGNEGCVALIPRVRRAMMQKKSSPREPLSTIVHNNLWTKNIMVKRNGECGTKIKVVDYQHFDYDSPAADLLFFLFTSAEISVLDDHLDQLFRHYYEWFSSELEKLEIEQSIPLQNFLKDIAAEASVQFPRIMMKLKHVFSVQLTEEHAERAWFIVQEFAKRNWI